MNYLLNKILFCLFDGHGGDKCSKFLKENFKDVINIQYKKKSYKKNK